MILLLNSQCFCHVADKVVDIAPAIEQGHHLFLRFLADVLIARIPHLPLRAQIAVDIFEQAVKLLLRLFETGL